MKNWLWIAAVVCAAVSAATAGCLRWVAGPVEHTTTERRPRFILWPPDWDRMAQVDPSKVDQYLAKVRGCGGNCAMLNWYGWDTGGRWAALKIRAAGLLVGQAFNANYSEAYARFDKSADATRHTSYVFSPATVSRSYCPSCRLPAYYEMIDTLRRCVKQSQPDFVVIDAEIWIPWESIEYYDRLHGTDMAGTIRKCRWCGSEEKYRRGLRQIADDFKQAVRSAAPQAEVYLWGQWDFSAVPRAKWPLVGESGLVPDGFSGPAPHFNHTTRPGVYRSWGFADPLAFMQHQLDTVSVRGGYPFLMAWADYQAKPSRDYLEPALFGRMCRLLADRGASGFSLYPGPKGIASPDYDAAREDPPRWALVEAGARAFGFLADGVPQAAARLPTGGDLPRFATAAPREKLKP